MPFYDYQAVDAQKACPHCRDGFEVRHGMNDPPVEKCPQCGNAVQRLISACRVDTRESDKAKLSDKNLKRLGFTKLVNEGEGKFRKTT